MPFRVFKKFNTRAISVKAFKKFNTRAISVKAFKKQRLLDLEAVPDKYPLSSSLDHQSMPLLDLAADSMKIEHLARMESPARMSGRIKSIRTAGKKLLFLDCWRDGSRLQIVCNAKSCADFTTLKATVSMGDIYEFSGNLGTTPAGQLSLFASSAKLLTPCLRPIPEELNNEEIKLRIPTLNFLVNPESLNRLKVRSQIISYLRNYLNARNFIEVETPILSALAGGANAKPFETIMNAHGDLPLKLRIAPELYLKQLIIGGFEKIYEIGKQFRNEGIDATHNPEFSTCELYQTYTTLEDMMAFSEDLLKTLIPAIQSSPVHISRPNQEPVLLDLNTPFQRLDVTRELNLFFKDEANFPKSISTSHNLQVLIDISKSKSIPLGAGPLTIPRVLDKLISHIIEPKCIQPTFITGHPLSMSPLSKESDTYPGTAARFELFIGGKEYINAYVELNDPLEQRIRFQNQQADRNAGDVEAQVLDEDFCVALEYGMPPTVGWGLGIDRLCMLVTGAKNIKDVISFPIVKPKPTNNEDEF